MSRRPPHQPPSQTGDTLTLSAQMVSKTLPAFNTSHAMNDRSKQFAGMLASAYMKFTVEGRDLSEDDSVQSFIDLADLHQRLKQDIQDFLYLETFLVTEDQQTQPLLLAYANYRLEQLSDKYRFACHQQQSHETKAELQAGIARVEEEIKRIQQSV